MAAVISSVLSSLVTSSALIGLAVYVFHVWAGARIKGEVDTQYAKRIETHKEELRAQTETELETLRAEIERDRALRTFATSAFASAHTAASERRLQAVQEIWDATVKTRRVANKLMLLVDILTREEIAAALGDPRMEERIGHPTDQEMLEIFTSPGSQVESMRPFVDEPLWAMFFGYRALLGRILAMLQLGRTRGQLQFWLDEKHTHAILASLLDAPELRHIEQMKVGGIAEAQGFIERRIVEAARKAVSGEAASVVAMEHARVILDLAGKAAKPAS